MPFATRFPWLRKISPATGRFTPGAEPTILRVAETVRIGPLICYEDVIPGPAREAAERGATLLLNLTNDAWYGVERGAVSAPGARTLARRGDPS